MHCCCIQINQRFNTGLIGAWFTEYLLSPIIILGSHGAQTQTSEMDCYRLKNAFYQLTLRAVSFKLDIAVVCSGRFMMDDILDATLSYLPAQGLMQYFEYLFIIYN